MPGPYSKCGKKVKDLLSKGYESNRKVTLKTKTSSGVTYTTTGTLAGKKSMLGSVEATYKHPSGFHLDKFSVDSAHTFKADISLNDQAEGLKFTLGVQVEDFEGPGSNEKAEVGLEYTHEMFMATLKTDPSNNFKFNGDILFGYNCLSFGGSLAGEIKVGADKTSKPEITDYTAAASYAMGKDASLSFLGTKCLTQFSGRVLHNYSKDMTFGVQADYDTTKANADKISIKAGGKYQLDGETSFQGMLNQAAKLSLSYSQFLRPMVKLTSSCVVDMNFVNNASAGGSAPTSFGCCLDLGDL